MELVAALSPELLTSATPPPGGAAPLQRSPAEDPAATPAALPFELLLGLLKAALPVGQSLPPTGNALPAAAVPTDATGPPGPSTAPPVPTPQTAATGDDVLARLRLGVGVCAADAGAATAAPPNEPTGTSPAVPFASVDAPPAPPPATPAPPAAAVASASDPAAAEVAAALTAALPRAADGDRPPPRPTPPSTDAGPATASSTPVVAVEQQVTAGAANPVDLAATVQPTHDTTRLARRDGPFEILPPAAAASDTGTTASGGAVAPPPAHGASTTADPADAASAAQGAPVDTRAEHWHDAFASRVQWLVDQQVGEARIKLNPPDLGAVDVKISLVEDKTFVHLTTATAAARDELAQSLPRLRELLSSSGLSLGGATVQGGQGGHGGSDRASHGGAPTLGSFGLADDDIAPVRALPRALGRIDLFA
jgi:flagellar hook-length control protein FliK